MSDHWTDDRIDHVYGAGTIGAKWVRDLRDEVESLKAKLAALSREHAQPAQVWTPVPHDFRLGNLTTWDDGYGDDDGIEDWWVAINDSAAPLGELRLCQRTPPAQEGAGAVEVHEAATAALGWIDDIYPPDIFIGKSESADEGVKMIAKIREDLRAALRQRPSAAHANE